MVAVLGLSALVAVAAWAIRPVSWDDFEATVDDLRTKGFAVTAADHAARTVVPEPTPPTDPSAPAAEAPAALADAWAALVAAVGEPETWNVTGPWDAAAKDPWFETATPEAKEALAARLDALDLHLRALERSAVRGAFPRRTSSFALDGSESSLSRDLQVVTKVSRVLGASASAHRDPRRRLDAAQALLRLGARGERNVVLVLMVAAACTHSGLRAARDLVESSALPASEVRAACDPELRRPLSAALPDAVRGEIAFLAEFARRAGRPSVGAETVRWKDVWRRSELAQILRSLGGDDDHGFGGSDPRSAAMFLTVMAEIAELRADDVRVFHAGAWEAAMRPARPPRGIEWLGGMIRRTAATDAAASLARVALAAAEVHAREGRWPSAPSDLAAAFDGPVPVDPTDGNPFTFTSDGTGLRVGGRGVLPDFDPSNPADLSTVPGARDACLAWDLRGE